MALDIQNAKNVLNEFSQGVGIGVVLRKDGSGASLEVSDSHLFDMIDPALSDDESKVIIEDMGIMMSGQQEREEKAYGADISNDPLLDIPAEKIVFDGDRATIRMEDVRFYHQQRS